MLISKSVKEPSVQTRWRRFSLCPAYCVWLWWSLWSPPIQLVHRQDRVPTCTLTAMARPQPKTLRLTNSPSRLTPTNQEKSLRVKSIFFPTLLAYRGTKNVSLFHKFLFSSPIPTLCIIIVLFNLARQFMFCDANFLMSIGTTWESDGKTLFYTF